MKKTLLAVLTLTLIWSCGNNNVTIEGKVNGGENLSIYLSELNTGNTTLIDSVKLSSNEEFKFNTHIEEGQLYTIRLSNGNSLTTIAQAEDKLYFKGNAKDFANSYTVKGGEDAKKAKILSTRLHISKEAIAKLIKELEEKTRSLEEVNKDYIKIIKAQRQFTKEFIVNNTVSLSAYMALYQRIDKNTYTLNENKDINFIRAVATSYNRLYPNSQYTKALISNLEVVSKKLAQIRLKEVLDNAPKNLPTIELPNGKEINIKLSSLKGKYILLDFTSLSNKNSIPVNKHYRKMYKKYKNKGLAIYQVSLDKSILSWKEMLKKQDITWINVWDKNSINGLAARNWNVKKIPTNFIINRQYEIVGKNQYGKDLEDKLKDIIR